jgi:hypothetical protein
LRALVSQDCELPYLFSATLTGSRLGVPPVCREPGSFCSEQHRTPERPVLWFLLRCLSIFCRKANVLGDHSFGRIAGCPVSRLAGVGAHFSRDLFLFVNSGFAEVEALLQIQPELRASPEIMSQTQSRLWSDAAPAVHYLADASCRDVNVHRELMPISANLFAMFFFKTPKESSS